jgi:hypothetical protein
MKIKLFVLFLLLFGALNTHAQGMIFNYNFTHFDDVYISPMAYIDIGEQITGYTSCNPANCLGAEHTPCTTTILGTNGGTTTCGNAIPAQNPMNYSNTSIAASVPFTGWTGQLDGWINCSIRGQHAVQDSSPVGIGSKVYFSSAITFLKAQANSQNVSADCDDTATWPGTASNPFGVQGGTPQPLYIEELGLIFSNSPPNSASSFFYFDAGYKPPESFNRVPWTHGGTQTGSPAPMPQFCTQPGTGKTQVNPSWQNPPN